MQVHPLKLHRRRRLVVVVVLLLVMITSPIGWALATGSAPDLPEWLIVFPAIIFFAVFIWAMVPLSVELSIEGDAVVVRRRGCVLSQIRRFTTRFLPYEPGNAGRAGSVIEIRGEGGKLRIGAAGHHPREHLPYEGPAVSSMQSWVDNPEALDALLIALRGRGVVAAVSAPAVTRFEVPLRPQGTSIRAIAPILVVAFAPILTMAIGAAVYTLAAGPRAEIPEWLALLAAGSYLPVGLLVWRFRPSRPRYFLRIDGTQVELLDAERRPIARADDVRSRIERQWQWRYRSWIGSAIALRFDTARIELGCLGQLQSAVGGTGRAPRWSVGHADFALLRDRWHLAV